MSAPKFVNKHLSYSRLSKYETCPYAFKLAYIDRRRSEPGVPLKFGKTIHATLEQLVREHVANERPEPLSRGRCTELFQAAWAKEGLTGAGLFQEGLEMLGGWICDQGIVDHRDVLAIEKEFRLPVGAFTVLGYIDRVDCVDDKTVEVIDLKTNRVLYTRDELDSSLQLGLYAIAAKMLWPWAKRVKLTFHMLRHGIRQSTERTDEQLQGVLRYVETLGRQTEAATEFPPRLNTYCPWCDFRKDCPAYADALAGKRELICEDSSDLEAVAREREEVASMAKILYARKKELEDVLKAHLDREGEMVLGGKQYRLFTTARLEYPFEPTLQVLAGQTGLSRDELVAQVATIDKKAMDKLVKEAAPDRAHARMYKLELDRAAKASHSSRLSAKGVA